MEMGKSARTHYLLDWLFAATLDFLGIFGFNQMYIINKSMTISIGFLGQ